MNDFAKLFTAPDIGQILVKLDESDSHEGPEVRFFYRPSNPALGVCSTVCIWDDNDQGWTDAERFFFELTQDAVVNFVTPHVKIANTFA